MEEFDPNKPSRYLSVCQSIAVAFLFQRMRFIESKCNLVSSCTTDKVQTKRMALQNIRKSLFLSVHHINANIALLHVIRSKNCDNGRRNLFEYCRATHENIVHRLSRLILFLFYIVFRNDMFERLLIFYMNMNTYSRDQITEIRPKIIGELMHLFESNIFEGRPRITFANLG